MADLSIDFAGIQSPNPFWLASAPPTNSGAQVMRAFDAGWGGAVWKTLGNPIVNVSSRLGSVRRCEQMLASVSPESWIRVEGLGGSTSRIMRWISLYIASLSVFLSNGVLPVRSS